jgi:hypothetical protein
MFIINTIEGAKFLVNESEYEAVIKADKSVYLPRIGSYISKSSISTAYPEQTADGIEDRKKQLTGRLHDGGRVKRHFGQWIMDNGFVPDDHGNYQPVFPDPNYYPEISKDCVMTEIEYEKVKHLPLEEIKKQLGVKFDDKEVSSFAKQLSDKFKM